MEDITGAGNGWPWFGHGFEFDGPLRIGGGGRFAMGERPNGSNRFASGLVTAFLWPTACLASVGGRTAAQGGGRVITPNFLIRLHIVPSR